jgi:hypothetical protein
MRAETADSVLPTDMDFYFLLFSLFFPRLVMLVYLVMFPNLFPANTVPQWADLLLGIFVPRILILIYIYQTMGYNNIWFAVHLVVMIFAYLGGGRETRRRRKRRGAYSNS